MVKRIYLICGEASGDIIGAKLIDALTHIKKKERDLSSDAVSALMLSHENLGNADYQMQYTLNSIPTANFKFYGVGGKMMQKQGLNSIFPMTDLSIMGFAEILPHIRKILKRIKETITDIKQVDPDIIITIDSPGFNFRIAKILRKMPKKYKIVHYVAPTVWAYKEKRAAKAAKLFDHMLLLLPFEKPYFDKVGLATSFVGHPIIEENLNDISYTRGDFALGANDKLVCILPGSRIGEVKTMLPIFLDSYKILYDKNPQLKISIATNDNLVGLVKSIVADKFPNKNTIIIDGKKNEQKEAIKGDSLLIISCEAQKKALYKLADIALCKSGTGALELSLRKVPVIVAYKVSTISYMVIKSMIKVKYANLINIILDKPAIPELLQDNCQPQLIADNMLKLLEDKEAINLQNQAAAAAFYELGLGQSPTPSEKAANIIARMVW